MNTELIKKYKTEFDHILNGGKLYGKLNKTHKWQSLRIEIFESWDNGWDIVIDDEYGEFRKALAEGKTIQANQSYGDYINEPAKWKDISLVILTNYPTNLLRIKPEEPQFKVGDWIECIDKKELCHHQKPIFKIDFIDSFGNCFGKDKETEYMNSKYAKLWTPQVGELCWFTNNKEKTEAILAKFYSYSNNVLNFKTNTNAFYYCEPFLNSKPSWFKD